jgi:hypothetical protein
MSITSLTNPTNYPSLQDNLWSIAYSNNSGQVDFKYVFDVFVDGVQLVRTKVYPEPSNGRGYFDAMPVVSNEITYGWFTPVDNNNGVQLIKSNNLLEKIYQIRVGEDYSGTTYLNLASGNVTAYNYSAPLFKRRQINIGQKLNNWLTNRPLRIKAKRTDKILIPLFAQGDDFAPTFKSYNANNQLIGSIVNDIYFESFFYNQLDIGVEALEKYFNYWGLTNILTSATSYYTIQFERADQYWLSDIIRVDIDCNPMYTPINLYFINAYGMFDTARFNLASRLMMDVERKTFQQRDYTFNNTSVDYYDANNVYRESKINYGSKSNHNYKLTMDYPTDAEYQWLAELIVSPQIYAEIDGNYYPVTIKTNNYEYSTYTNNRLKALEIEIELNQTRYNFKR